MQNLLLVDANLVGVYNSSKPLSSSYIGILTGSNDGLIIGCACTGSVEGRETLGGMVGNNAGTLRQCYADVSVNGNDGIGGLIGYNRGNVVQSFNLGEVRGTVNVGGIAGDGYRGEIVQSYSACVVSGGSKVGGLIGSGSGNVVSCFWDTQASGVTVSDGGIGLTMVEMKDRETFTRNGWDFRLESANGLGDVWELDGQDRYPHLSRFSGYTTGFTSGEGTRASPYR